MKVKKFSPCGRTTIALASREARRVGRSHVNIQHLFIASLSKKCVRARLEELEIDVNKLVKKIRDFQQKRRMTAKGVLHCDEGVASKALSLAQERATCTVSSYDILLSVLVIASSQDQKGSPTISSINGPLEQCGLNATELVQSLARY